MRCAACRPLLSKYSDNEATAAEVRLVEEHVGGCARCSAELTEFRLMRAMLVDAPRRTPDPRVREQLFRALAAYDAAHPPGARDAERARPAPRRAWNWMGNLAGAIAVLLLVVSGILIARTGDPAPPGSKTPTSVLSNLSVPTPMSPIAEAPPTRGASGLLGGPSEPMPHTATGTPAWRPEPEEATTHKIQDARFGYVFTYPGNWWSAPVPATGRQVVSRRQVAPWPLDDPAADSPYYLLIDVLANPGRLSVEQARQEALVPLHYVAVVQQGRLTGVRGERSEAKQDLDEVYLFDDTVIYRLSAVIPQQGKDGADPARRKAAALIELDKLLNSFNPPPAGPLHELGYAPALVLRDGNLWAVEPDGSNPRALTTAGDVRAFRLAPDLRKVALVTTAGTPQTAAWGARIVLLDRLDGKGKLQNIWFTNEIHDLDWYGNEELVVIADDPEAARGLALYRIPARPGAGAERRLVDLANHPQAARLQVSPDRLWIAFLAETNPGSKVGELYGVRPNGAALGPLTPRLGGNNGIRSVQEFAWLPQPRGGQPAGTAELVLLERQGTDPAARVVPVLLTVPPVSTGLSPSRLPLDSGLDQQQARFLTVNAQGRVAYAVFNRAGAWQGLRTADSQAADPPATVQDVEIRPGAPAPAALGWSPDAAHLLVQTGGAPAPVGLQRLDLATGASVTVLEPNH